MSSAIRKAAKGGQCTPNIAGVCNDNPETVVLCRFPGETHGAGLKSGGLGAGFGCGFRVRLPPRRDRRQGRRPKPRRQRVLYAPFAIAHDTPP